MDSPTSELIQTQKPSPKSMPGWLKVLLVILLLAAVGVGIYFLVQALQPKSGSEPNFTLKNMMPPTIRPSLNMMTTTIRPSLNMMPPTIRPTTT